MTSSIAMSPKLGPPVVASTMMVAFDTFTLTSRQPRIQSAVWVSVTYGHFDAINKNQRQNQSQITNRYRYLNFVKTFLMRRLLYLWIIVLNEAPMKTSSQSNSRVIVQNNKIYKKRNYFKDKMLICLCQSGYFKPVYQYSHY